MSREADVASLYSLHIAPAGEGTSGDTVGQNNRDLGAAPHVFGRDSLRKMGLSAPLALLKGGRIHFG